MKRSGFTLVEMSVVLVIMGIIILIAVKSLDYINAAKLRNNVAVVYKHELALKNFVNRYEQLPAANANNFTLNNVSMVTALVQSGLLTNEDYLLSSSAFGVDNTLLGYVRCLRNTADGPFVAVNDAIAGNNIVSAPICLTASTVASGANFAGLYTNGAINNTSINNATPFRFRAGYEIFYDDSNVNNGYGRMGTFVAATTLISLKRELDRFGVSLDGRYMIAIYGFVR